MLSETNPSDGYNKAEEEGGGGTEGWGEKIKQVWGEGGREGWERGERWITV